jgi:hypothetical protein
VQRHQEPLAISSRRKWTGSNSSGVIEQYVTKSRFLPAFLFCAAAVTSSQVLQMHRKNKRNQQ